MTVGVESRERLIYQSYYDQTCVLINYICNETESGLVKLRVLLFDCHPLKDETLPNCTENQLQLVDYFKITCEGSKSSKKIVTNEDFNTCEDSTSISHYNVSFVKRMKHNCTFITPNEGLYGVELFIHDQLLSDDDSWSMSHRSVHGYIIPTLWPLLVFYQMLLSVYIFYLLIWLVLCCYYRSDLLQLQYYITFIISLGLIENAVFVAEKEYFNRTGKSIVFSTIAFGEIISALKRTSARILVIIVSLGFGIVRPRLGRTLYALAALGLSYFILSASHGIAYQKQKSVRKKGITAVLEIGLVILDAAIICWIFLLLVRTMRALRVRKNTVKLSVYKHFRNTLIFGILASFVFSVASFVAFQIPDCLVLWDEVWVDIACWPFLFSLLLLVIMVLWRPSANNQRYAFSPLNDTEDDESEEPMINEAFDGVKIRNKPDGKPTNNQHHQENPLRWVEENIPMAIDVVVPSILLGSEDELETTLFELNKMQ